MAYVPNDARWFLADLIEEIRVEGSRRNIVHINHVLVEAASPEEAYVHALEIGGQGSQEYVNSLGRKVTVRFRGLRNLDVIHEPLEHGCEIMFQEKLGVSEKGIRKLIRPKEKLEVFAPIRKPLGRPDYASKEIMDELHRRIADPNP